MKKLIHRRNPCPSLEDGYALIESLIAIIVVTILLTAVTPMIVFSAGSRMQAKRIQLATQASRSYLAELNDDSAILPPGNQVFTQDEFTNFPAPDKDQLQGGGNDEDCLNDDEYCRGRVLYCVNFDETPGCQADSMVDMVVQPIGFFITSDNGQPDLTKGYNLELRVYRANSFADSVGELQADDVDNSIAQALGNRTLPLFKTATFISPASTTDRSLYNSYCDRIPGGCS